MTYKNVTSTAIQKIGYDAETKEMIVVFHNGSEKKHDDVSEERYKSLLNAESIGKSYADYNKKPAIVKRKMNFK